MIRSIKLPGLKLYAGTGATAFEASIVVRAHEFHGRIPKRRFLLVGSGGLVAWIDPEGVWHRKDFGILPHWLVRRVRRFAYTKEEWERQRPHHEWFDRHFKTR